MVQKQNDYMGASNVKPEATRFVRKYNVVGIKSNLKKQFDRGRLLISSFCAKTYNWIEVVC